MCLLIKQWNYTPKQTDLKSVFVTTAEEANLPTENPYHY